MGDLLSQHPTTDSEADSEESAGSLEADQTRAVAEYLADMIGQLESMARVAGLELLVYLLSMARVEADSSARLLAQRDLPPSQEP